MPEARSPSRFRSHRYKSTSSTVTDPAAARALPATMDAQAWARSPATPRRSRSMVMPTVAILSPISTATSLRTWPQAVKQPASTALRQLTGRVIPRSRRLLIACTSRTHSTATGSAKTSSSPPTRVLSASPAPRHQAMAWRTPPKRR